MAMVNIIKTTACLLLLALMSFDSSQLPKKFSSLLERAQLTFEAPEGLKPTKIIENRQMNYEYALKYPATDFEVRYAIRPLDNLLKDYEQKEKNKQPGDINIHPNKLYNSLLQATILNISGGQLPEIKVFDKNAVKQEFNADWGALSFVELGKEFGQDYKYCLVVAIHKEDVADAYFFYLSKSRDRFDELMQPAFHSLKFK
jgi:hypothetical protein